MICKLKVRETSGHMHVRSKSILLKNYAGGANIFARSSNFFVTTNCFHEELCVDLPAVTSARPFALCNYVLSCCSVFQGLSTPFLNALPSKAHWIKLICSFFDNKLLPVLHVPSKYRKVLTRVNAQLLCKSSLALITRVLISPWYTSSLYTSFDASILHFQQFQLMSTQKRTVFGRFYFVYLISCASSSSVIYFCNAIIFLLLAQKQISTLTNLALSKVLKALMFLFCSYESSLTGNFVNLHLFPCLCFGRWNG